MRLSAAVLLSLSLMSLPIGPSLANPEGQMVTLKADQIGEVFCLSRVGNDEALISGILTDALRTAIADAETKDDAYAKKYPGEKPPLGDGIPWQSAPDYAPKCTVGLVTLMKADAKVELQYSFPDAPAADFVDTLILKKVDQPDFDVGFWRIDNVFYPDGTDLKSALVDAFEGTE